MKLNQSQKKCHHCFFTIYIWYRTRKWNLNKQYNLSHSVYMVIVCVNINCVWIRTPRVKALGPSQWGVVHPDHSGGSVMANIITGPSLQKKIPEHYPLMIVDRQLELETVYTLTRTCMSSSEMLKSNTSPFSMILCSLADFGMHILPRCRLHRISSCAVDFLYLETRDGL